MKRQSFHTAATARGFTLVEVLVALVIMSVGMLGIAGLYLHSIQAGRTSLFRHHAVTLAGDIADRIRANPAAGIGYEAAGANNYCGPGGGVTCTPAQMAEDDILLWTQQALQSLPAGAVTVAFTDVADPAPDSYVITVSWNEAGQIPPPSYSVTIPVKDFTGP